MNSVCNMDSMKAARQMKNHNSPKERRVCGTCFWYDPLGDLCWNEASPHDFEHMGRGEGCRKWEKDRG